MITPLGSGSPLPGSAPTPTGNPQSAPGAKLKLREKQGSAAGPYAGLSLLKVKESLKEIQMVQTLHRSANILYICIHENV